MGNVLGGLYRSLIVLGVFALASCSKQSELSVPVTSNQVQANEALGVGTGLTALGSQTVRSGLASGSFHAVESAEAKSFLDSLAGHGKVLPVKKSSLVAGESLVLAFPIGLIGEQQVFGGVITTVSAKDNEDLGGLKLTDLTPVHVTTRVAKDTAGQYSLALEGCLRACEEGSAQVEVQRIPIVAVSETEKKVLLNLSAIAEDLNLIQMLDPEGESLQLKTKSATTVALDYSDSTLVFDVKVAMEPLVAGAEGAMDVDFTIRWYLKLASAFDSAFTVRTATPGVGYFMTERSITPKVQRWKVSPVGSQVGNVKYYLKNVPVAYQAAFAGAFDEWNEKFVALMGRKLLDYEFVAEDDARNALLVPGDPRYRILEWDLVNLAGYGGLGPSIANQNTGEMLTANVLIQGPKIIEIYTKWFAAGERARTLLAEGRVMEASQALKLGSQDIQASLLGARKGTQFQVSLGKIPMRVTSQIPELSDPLFQREDFDLLPEGFSFETYMPGYFHDMVAHELGHNLGLRHNFFGNLEAAPGAPQFGKVSSSIMEYLGRSFRYLDRIGSYDEMAIAYAYRGIAPQKTDGFCTDENVPSADSLVGSAECSRDDATPDPFGFLVARLDRAVGLIVGAGSTESPVWKVDDMKREITAVVKNLGIYAATAETSGSTWKRFFTGGERPETPAGVKAYVLSLFKKALCGEAVQTAIDAKATPMAKAETRSNLEALHARVKELLEPIKVFSPEEVSCSVE